MYLDCLIIEPRNLIQKRLKINRIEVGIDQLNFNWSITISFRIKDIDYETDIDEEVRRFEDQGQMQ